MTTPTDWESFFAKVPSQEEALPKLASSLFECADNPSRATLASNCPNMAMLAADSDRAVHIIHHLHHDTGGNLVKGSDQFWACDGGGQRANVISIDRSNFNKMTQTSAMVPTIASLLECSDEATFRAVPAADTPLNQCRMVLTPAFMTVDLMKADTDRPGAMAVAAVNSIKTFATTTTPNNADTEEPTAEAITARLNEVGDMLGYVCQFLWLACQVPAPTRAYPHAAKFSIPNRRH